MRSRRSAIWERRTELCSRRSSRLSLGPASDFRRARASDEVIGAGATGPLRPALRRGVGRPLGAVVCRGAAPKASAASTVIWASSRSSVTPASFFRPSSLTLARLLPADVSGKRPGRSTGLTVAQMTGSAHRSPTLRMLIAPDSYGDTLTAVEAAAAIAAGWNPGGPRGHPIVAPPAH